MKKYILTLILALASLGLYAQTNRNKTIINAALHGWEYEIKAGVNLGGTAPLPFPEEIRSIDGYNPTLSITIEGNMTKWLDTKKKWGIITGLRLENKGMRTKATVKNYNMEIIGYDGNRLKGNWTGGVRTKVQNSYITIPVLAAYKLSPRTTLKLGPYFSYLMDGDFSGHVYEGYCVNQPTRQINSPRAIATYDFSGDLRKFQVGVQAGVELESVQASESTCRLEFGA